jgi:hypothetical protein
MTTTKKPAIHNEWFQPIVKTTCPCGAKKTSVFAWGNYVNAKWRTVDHFCKACFGQRVVIRLLAHADPCGCMFNMNARSGYGPLPTWISFPFIATLVE